MQFTSVIKERATLPNAGAASVRLWPDDDCFYPGCVESVIPDPIRHIPYDYGDNESPNLRSEAWRYCLALQSSPSSVQSQFPTVLNAMHEQFGNKPFKLHQSNLPLLLLSTMHMDLKRPHAMRL